MKKKFLFLSALLGAALSAQAANFTPGNLAVFSGDDSSSKNGTFTIQEVNSSTANQSSPVQSFPINGTTLPGALRSSANAGTTGLIADSDDGSFVVFAGHNTATTSGNINTILPRGVGTLDNGGNYTLQTTYTGASGNQTRCATTPDNLHWIIGDQGGIYTNLATTPTPTGNFRGIKSFSHVVYVLQESATITVVSTVTNGTVVALPGLPADNAATDFYLVSSGSNGSTFDVLYTVGTDAVKKYSLVAGTWTANGSSTAQPGLGLCATTNSGGVFLFLTTGDGATAGNKVVKLVDAAGYNTAVNITGNTVLFTATAPAVMKGIAFAPIIACVSPVVSAPSVSPDSNVCSTASVTFTASATGGTTPYVYQWQKNGSNISVATASNYTGVAGTDFVNGDQLRVSVSSACGGSASFSPAVVMTVNTAPGAPTATSASSIGTTGFNANWNITSGATGYRLDVATDNGFTAIFGSFNNVDVSNVLTAAITGLNPNTIYYYRVRAYNICGTSGNSGTINVTTAAGCNPAVAALPVASPANSVCAGTTLTLTETPSAGTAPFNYQWKQGGVTLNNGGTISGATSASLQISGVAASDTAAYTCDVTAQCGGATSTSVGLSITVNALPTITLGATTAICGGSNSASLPYSATTSSPDQYSITWDSAAHSAGFVDTSFATLAASPINLTVPAAPAGTYNGTVNVRNSTTNCASSGAAFTIIINANPVITAQPISAIVVQGSNATFSITTTATSPGYQWQINKGSGFVNVSGGDGSIAGGGASFITTTATNTMSGYQYRCVVSDGITACSTISSVANLIVPVAFTTGDLAIFSADFAASNNTSFSIIELDTNTANQAAVQSISINGNSGSAALRTSGSASSTGYLSDGDDGSYLAFTGHNATNLTGNANNIVPRGVGTFDSTGKFTLQATYSGSGGNQTRCATTVNDVTWYVGDQNGIYTNNSSSLTNVNVRSVKSYGGTVYVLQQSTTASAAVISTLSSDGKTLAALPGLINDSTAVDFCLVSSGSNGSTFDVLYVLENASASIGAVLKYSLIGGSWNVVGGGTYLSSFGGFGMCGTRNGNGATLYLTTGTGATAGNSVVKLTDTFGWNNDININDGDDVTLYTGGASTTIKGIAFAPVEGQPCTPIIQADPTFQIVTNGATASFSINATGSSLTYQWQQNKIDIANGGTISGVTSSNLVLTGVGLADSDTRWRCVVFSGGGCSNVSATARLIVNSVTPLVPFGSNNVILEVVGDGANALASSAIPISLLELTADGTVAQTMIMQSTSTNPAAAPFNCLESGSASSDGNLTRSADGRYIILPGYNAANGEPNVTATSDLRTLALIDYNGGTNTPHGLNIGAAVNFRGATSSDGVNFWLAGQNTSLGLYYFNPVAGVTNQLSTFNTRTVKIVSNQLYACSGANSPGNGIFMVGAGLPTSGTPAWTLVITNGTHSHSPYNFEFNPATNVCYVSDDGPTTNFNGVLNGGGIQKYTNTTDTGWQLAYIITNGFTKGNGAYGLAVDWSSANPVLYATTATSTSNRLVRIIDDSGSLSAATTIYAPASDNYYLRGVVMAPSFSGSTCTPPTITGDPAPATAVAAGNTGFSVSATGASLTYQWQKNGANVSDGGTISGSTTPTLSLSGVAITDSGSQWQCVVTSSGACSDTSDPALLTVYTPYQAWQFQYFGSTNAAKAAMNADADGTGQNNFFKFVAGLDPTNPASVFVLKISNVTGQPTQKNLTFNPIAAGRIYTVQACTNLLFGSFTDVGSVSAPVTNGTQVTITDLSILGSNEFYRVNITLP